MKRGLFLSIALLYVLSVPWYRESGAEPSLLLGLPDWVAVALLCYVGAAALNCVAWCMTDVEDDAGASTGARSDGAFSQSSDGAFSQSSDGALSPRSDGALSPRSDGALSPRSKGALSPRSKGALGPRRNGPPGE